MQTTTAPKVTFGKTEDVMGDKQAEILLNGEYAGYLNKADEGDQWYTLPDVSPFIEDRDCGTTLREAKAEVKEMVRELFEQRQQAEQEEKKRRTSIAALSDLGLADADCPVTVVPAPSELAEEECDDKGYAYPTRRCEACGCFVLRGGECAYQAEHDPAVE